MQRHDLLQVDPKPWQTMLAEHPWLTSLPLVADWAAQGWPVVVRRPAANDAACAIPAGLPLPPCYGKHRLGFSLQFEPGVATRAPVQLRDAASEAPAAWRATIAALVDLGAQTGVAPRVFGALLWQHVTGLPYLTEHSDLDLLWAAPDHATLTTLLAGLRRLDATSPVRLDGELQLPCGGGVNWRELTLSAERGLGEVLVKTMSGVKACHIDDLFAMAPAT